jgi:hypothetical protein
MEITHSIWRQLVKFMLKSHTCRANSLVGDRIRALAPLFAILVLSFSKSGIRKQAVLPLPVLAMATTSRPSRTKGIVCKKLYKFNARKEIQGSTKSYLCILQ